ncbi:UvrD-helicase domain-containing protein [Stutzerimonas stutzeri]|uniref:UvrD-helicase domain-containing protein n=1 Tax=Stutzerimonas stutzeri TaxID=316 RepID=UPI001BCB60CF|nr:UvrD-helicase domain-containing protein [Stutzerimonas stutzeri]
MNAFTSIPSLTVLDRILAAVAASNPHDGPARAAAMDPRKSIVCLAPAGSGKTTELIYRMLACLATSTKPEEVLAITFTTLAAGEIKERLMDALAMAASGVAPSGDRAHELPLYDLARLVLERDAEMGWSLQLNPSRLRIMTFDSFSAYLASKTPIMSGLGGGQTTDDPHLIYRQAILETLGSVNDDSIPAELRLALEEVLGFAKNQFEKLVPMFSNLISKRDQWAGELINLDVAAMETALQGTIKLEKAKALNVLRNGHIDGLVNVVADAAGTLEGFDWASAVPAAHDCEEYASFLVRFGEFALKADGDLRTMVNAKNGFPAGHSLTKRCNELFKELKDTSEAVEYAAALRQLKALPEDSFPEFSARMCGHFTIILRYLLANLTLAFEDNAALDFPEVASRAIQALGNDLEVGDALLEEDRINHILVDEVQDSSPNQYLLLERLVDDWAEGDGRSLFFCGDTFQSIYLFRNATPEWFIKIVNSLMFGPRKLELQRLVLNFRSAPGVVEWNNDAYEKVFAQSATPFVRSVPARKGEGGVVVRPVSEGPIGEGMEVAQQVANLLQADPAATIAILVRARSHMKHVLAELKARGISVSGQKIDPIIESAPVSEVIALIRSLWHIGDRTSWLALLRSAFVGLSWEDCAKVARGDRVIPQALADEKVMLSLSADGQLRAMAFLRAYNGVVNSSRGEDLAWASKALWASLGGPATVDATELEDVLTVFSLLLQHTANGCLEKPQAFFRAVASLYATAKPGSVVAMTIHNSKGLEFDHVIIPGLNSRSAPDEPPLFHWQRMNDTFVLAPNPGSLVADGAPESRLFQFLGAKVKQSVREEIARLAYVMTTRAKKTCTLYASFEKLDEDTSGSFSKGSLLEALWPAVEQSFVDMAPGMPIKAETQFGVPSKARLQAGYSPALPVEMFIPASSTEHMPTESDLSDDTKETQGEDFCARVDGIVFHKVVELIGKQGVEGWDAARVKAKSAAISAMLLREGYPSREVPRAVSRIVDLLCTTIASKTGQWFLKRRESSGQEVRVSSYQGGRWIHRILDLSFEDEQMYWVADWKTSSPREGESVESFAQREAEKYAAKMREYSQAAKDAGITLPIKRVLYFPAVDHLQQVA